MIDTLLLITAATLGAGTPLMLAGLGELVTERAGVLNLGVEGMMLMGAVCGFALASTSGSLWLGVAGAIVAGMAMAAVFGVLVLVFQANQVASGLALTIFGTGLSAFVGLGYTGAALKGFRAFDWPTLQSIPILGPTVFSLDPLVYLAFVILVLVAWFLSRTKSGLVLRAVGESPHSATALGYRVLRLRFGAVLFGGAFAGLAGGYLSLAYTPLWAEGMTAGRGWIALALVVFATWRPGRLVIGAYLFGGITISQLHVQSTGLAIPSELLSALPYLATIVVLVIISRDQSVLRLEAPASLGKAYHPRFEK
ncbi:MAG: ABC-type uncharacterized transport system permease subunit [Gammaproteobacteria bacterium]|jgi:ABC-type uncharacterized transport system permease subunit